LGEGTSHEYIKNTFLTQEPSGLNG